MLNQRILYQLSLSARLGLNRVRWHVPGIVCVLFFLSEFDCRCQVDSIRFEDDSVRKVLIKVGGKPIVVQIVYTMDKFVLTPNEMVEIGMYCSLLGIDTVSTGRGESQVTAQYSLVASVGRRNLPLTAEVSYNIPSQTYFGFPTLGLKSLLSHGLRYELGLTHLYILEASSTPAYSIEDVKKALMRRKKVLGHMNEVRIVPCSETDGVDRLKVIIGNTLSDCQDVVLITSFENEQPPKKAVDRIESGLTIRYFSKDSKDWAETLQDELGFLFPDVQVHVEDMQPYFKHEISSYVEVWIKSK